MKSISISLYEYDKLSNEIYPSGIGADDCFVFVKEWRLSADEWDVTSKHLPKRKTKKLIFLVSNTMGHAAKAIFVTSLTTAHAFLASYSSSITAIRCFG